MLQCYIMGSLVEKLQSHVFVILTLFSIQSNGSLDILRQATHMTLLNDIAIAGDVNNTVQRRTFGSTFGRLGNGMS